MTVSLETDRGAISLNPFVQRFVSNVLWAALISLKISENVREAEFLLNEEGVKILASGEEVKLINVYAKNTITDVLRAILKNLSGTAEVTQATFRLQHSH